jgi:hypothetical protein
MTDLDQLCNKLCRELAQSEHDADVHTRREARRLGDAPPARALRAISAHAAASRPRLAALMRQRHQRVGLGLGRAVGAVFAVLRHAIFDRVIGAERSFRATLLGLRHGIDAMRLLRAVAAREGDLQLAGYCDDVLVERLVLVAHAERALGWFADRPGLALRSGWRLALHSGHTRAR